MQTSLRLFASLFIPILLLTITGCSSAPDHTDDPELRALYEQLDNEINISKNYEDRKVKRIEQLRSQLGNTVSGGTRQKIAGDIVGEYESYNADSALYYAERAIDIANENGDALAIQTMRLKEADIYAHAGLFPNALGILESINSTQLPKELLDEYYSTYNLTYQYLCEYVEGSTSAQEYSAKRDLYADSLKSISAPGSFDYAVYCLSAQARSGNSEATESALRELKENLKKYSPGDRRYSILASIISDISRYTDHPADYRRYIALSAISDIKGVIKENMSFREAANAAMTDGDVERANRYLKKSFEDANFFSARMRKDQSSKILPSIDNAYSELQKKLARQQKAFTVSICILAVILGVLAVISMRQTLRLRRANRTLNTVNGDLSRISGELRVANERLATANSSLEDSNSRLSDSNLIKEQYAGLFMESCSSTIGILQKYHNSLKVLANQSGLNTKIAKKLESTEFIDSAVKDFYLKFDEAILNIYPDFPTRVNELLIPGEELKCKSPDQLNTELRVLALIRIGITDNSKIADFLRCSITTVYTYRSKLRKRAVNPDGFEESVRRIYA